MIDMQINELISEFCIPTHKEGYTQRMFSFSSNELELSIDMVVY